MVDIGNHHQRFVKTLGTHGHDQKILNVHTPPRVGTATKNLDFRQGQAHRFVACQIAPQWQVFAGRRRLQHRQRGGDGGVGTQAAFERCAI